MTTFGPETAAKIHAQTTASCGEIAQALTRTLGRPMEVAIGEVQPVDPEVWQSSLAGPGLAVLLQVENAAD